MNGMLKAVFCGLLLFGAALLTAPAGFTQANPCNPNVTQCG